MTDGAVRSDEMAAQYDKFIWVLVNHAKIAKEFEPAGGGANIMIFDPDGVQIHKANVQSKTQEEGFDKITKAIDTANEKYKNKEITWTTTEGAGTVEANEGTLVAYTFVDDKDASTRTLKAFEDRWVAKDHEKMVFVKFTGKDSDLAKKFKVSVLPTVVFCDPSQGDKQVIDTKTGELSARGIKMTVVKCLEKMEKAKAAKK